MGTEIQLYINEVKNLLKNQEFAQTLKRIIDLTLDTEELTFYQKTCDLLQWYDYNKSNTEQQIQKFSTLLDELTGFLSEKEIIKKQVLVESSGLQKQYSNSAFALGPIDLKITQGEVVGLVGENGNGKTTLLRLLCKELIPTYGDISYNFNYLDDYDLRTRLVYIPQRTPVWQGSLMENLIFTASCYGYSPEENEKIVDLMISRMGLRDYKNHQWKNLSSGYKMRFELARMMLRKPKLLLIDEPLANLDVLAQQTVLEDFKNIAKSPFRPLAIVLSSQQLYEVERTSDKVIMLKHGVIKNNEETLETSNKLLIIEFECNLPQEKLKEIFSELKIIKLSQNGGTFTAEFPENISSAVFLKTVADKQIDLLYFRNISNSTKRFFTN